MSAVSLQVNADGFPKPRLYADTGGRPPDGILQIPIPLTLERPASPSPLEGQSVAKKVRNDEDLNSVAAGDVIDMEAELGDDVTVKKADLCATKVLNSDSASNRTNVMDGKARDVSSYASKVVNGEQMDTGGKQKIGFIEEEDNCSPPKACEDNPNMVDSDITPRGSNKISDSNLYGPWMVVDTRRRRTIRNTRFEVGNTSGTQALQGSRFAALASENNDEHVVAPLSGMRTMHEIGSNLNGDRQVGKFTEQHTTNRNEAYMTSNPDRKSKASKRVTESINVVPIVRGKEITVVEHTPRVATGSHAAVRINEEGNSGVNYAKKPLKGDGGVRKGLKESTRKGLHVKKPSASRVPRSSVVEWVQSAHARVDILGQQVADGRNEKFVISTNEQTDMCASDEDNFGDTSYMDNISDDVGLLADGVEGNQ
ncbi:hypothetical protein V6N13_127731 [Hibiscus sabdariffa]|uniref:Uncharacterized protein n=1 Tax=Hibiscus sabdariffa TaxID=183260 RepID=A0ABR2CDI2_9ROSI